MSNFSLFGGKKDAGKVLREEASRALLDGDYARALELYSELHEKHPDDLRIWAKVAELKEKTGDTEASVADYEKIAQAYTEQGFVVQAIAVNKLILRLDPNRPAVQENLRALTAARGDGGEIAAASGGASTENIRTGLASTPLLSGMSGEQLGSFIDSLQVRNLDAGEFIYRVGEPGDYLYLIGMGQVSLQATDPNGRKKVFSRLKEGDFFGERAFMSRIAHKDEAVAESDCSILMVDRATFDRWVEEHPEIRATVEGFYRQRVLKRVLAITPVFEGVPEDARMALADKFTLRSFDDGDTIMEVGEIGNTFYLIRSGSVQLTVPDAAGGNAFECTLGEGDFFGEVALLTGRPRTATICAKGAVELMELSRADFDEIAESYPHVRKVVQDYMRARARETIDALRHQQKHT